MAQGKGAVGGPLGELKTDCLCSVVLQSYGGGVDLDADVPVLFQSLVLLGKSILATRQEGGYQWMGVLLRQVEAPALPRVSSLTWHFSLDSFLPQPRSPAGAA